MSFHILVAHFLKIYFSRSVIGLKISYGNSKDFKKNQAPHISVYQFTFENIAAERLT